MRWSSHGPHFWQMRRRRGFLFFPKLIHTEWRWLEWSSWWEQYLPATYQAGHWKAVQWIRNEKKEGV